MIYSGRAFTVRSDRIELPNGRTTTLDIVEHGGAVIIAPMTDNGRFVMVRQYRHAARTTLLEFPAGTLEKGEDPHLCAQRELREETGFAAARFERIGGFFLAPGYSTEYLHVFLATGLTPDPLPRDADEFLEVETIRLRELLDIARSGRLEDAKTLASLQLLLAHPSIQGAAGI